MDRLLGSLAFNTFFIFSASSYSLPPFSSSVVWITDWVTCSRTFDSQGLCCALFPEAIFKHHHFNTPQGDFEMCPLACYHIHPTYREFAILHPSF